MSEFIFSHVMPSSKCSASMPWMLGWNQRLEPMVISLAASKKVYRSHITGFQPASGAHEELNLPGRENLKKTSFQLTIGFNHRLQRQASLL